MVYSGLRKNDICPGCTKGKMHNKPFPVSGRRASQPFDLIHADLIKLPIRAYHKRKWACMLMDDYSSFAYCFILQSKDETYTAVMCCQTVPGTSKKPT